MGDGHLRDLVEQVTTKAVGRKPSNARYIGLEHIESTSRRLTGTVPASVSDSTNGVFEPGDILFGKLRPNLRKSVQVDFQGFCSTDLIVMRTKPGVDPAFAAHVASSESVFRHAEQNSIGTGMPRTSWRAVANSRCRVPSLCEQRRIAKVLDTIDETIQASERVIAKLWDTRAGLLQEQLDHIDAGESTVPLLSRVSLPKGQVDPKAEPFRSMTLVAPDHVVGGGRGRLLERVSAGAQGAISGKYRFRSGDVVYSKIRPELRKAWLADSSGLCSADMYPLTPSESLDSGYLAQVILGDRFSRFAESVSGRSSGMPKVNRQELSEFGIAVPPVLVQRRVAGLAFESMARIDAETAPLKKLIETRSGLAADLLSGRVRMVAA